jgi:antitoxin YefM
MTSVHVRDATLNLEAMVRAVVEDASQTILTTDNGEQAILMSFAEYRSIQETEFLLSNPKTAMQMYQALDEIKNNQVISIPLESL